MSLSSNPAPDPSLGGGAGDRFELDVAEGEEGLRLDRFLAVRLPALSRARLQALVRDGRLLAGGGDAVLDPSRRVRPGERYALELPPSVAADPAAEEGRELEVLFEDEHLLVLVKPAGLVVHPAPGHRDGTLVNA